MTQQHKQLEKDQAKQIMMGQTRKARITACVYSRLWPTEADHGHT